MLVVDASVVVSLFVREPLSPAAEALVFDLRGRPPLIAPDMLSIETAAALTRRVRRGETPRGDAAPAMAQLPRLGIRLHAFAPLLDSALELALAHRHALPDCLYLALARREGAGLVTFDERLAALAERLRIPLWSPEPAP
jgi:predicted nucleic acid-binding protein